MFDDILKGAKKWAVSQAPAAIPHVLPSLLKKYGFTDSRATLIMDQVKQALEKVKQYHGVSEQGASRSAVTDILRELSLTRQEQAKMFKAAEHPVVKFVLEQVDPTAIATLKEELSSPKDVPGNPLTHSIRDRMHQSSRAFNKAGDYPSVSKKP